MLARFEREYGFFRPIVKEVVERYLDCGNPRCGFARIPCPDWVKYKRRLLGDLCRCALRSLTRYFEVVTGSALTPGVIAAINYRAEDGLLIRAKRSARFVR